MLDAQAYWEHLGLVWESTENHSVLDTQSGDSRAESRVVVPWGHARLLYKLRVSYPHERNHRHVHVRMHPPKVLMTRTRIHITQ